MSYFKSVNAMPFAIYHKRTDSVIRIYRTATARLVDTYYNVFLCSYMMIFFNLGLYLAISCLYVCRFGIDRRFSRQKLAHLFSANA